MGRLKDAFNALTRRVDRPALRHSYPTMDFGHRVCDAAFGSRVKAQEYKMAADAALPWLHDLTLSGHTVKEGMWQGFNGFMGYPALSLLQQNGLIKACIDTIADEMTRRFIELKENDGSENYADSSDDLKRLKDAMLKYDLRGLFNRAIRANELFGGCMIFIDTGASDEDLLRPLHIADWSTEVKKFRGFQIIEPINVFPGYYNSVNPLALDYFEPHTWWVLGTRVHASRLIKFQTSDLWQVLKPAYNFFGVPHAQILWDYVIHFQKCRVATATAATKFSRTILKTDAETLFTEEGGVNMLHTRLAMLADMNNDGMTAIDMEGEDIAQVNMPLAGLTDITWQGLEMLCVVNKSPAVKTLGVSPSGFSATGDSDFKNWYDHVHSKQERDISSQVKKCLDILQIVEFGGIRKSIAFEFTRLSEDNKQAAADVDKTRVDTATSLVQNNIITEGEARDYVREYPESPFAGLMSEEERIRSLGDVDVDANKQKTSLAGIQFRELRETANEVGLGIISRETGIKSIALAYQISEEEAEAILGPVDFVPTSQEVDREVEVNEQVENVTNGSNENTE